MPAAIAADPMRFIACTPAIASFDDACVSATLVGFAERAYRRELVDDELAELAALYDSASLETADFTEAATHVFEGLLLTPAFLYRNDIAVGDDPLAPVELDDFALASRLSYFVWSSMPDHELFELARADMLRDPATLRAQTRRMRLDAKAGHFLAYFARGGHCCAAWAH